MFSAIFADDFERCSFAKLIKNDYIFLVVRVNNCYQHYFAERYHSD